MFARKSLLELLAEVPDPRGEQGKFHPLSAVLGLVVVAMLAGARGPAAISQYGRDQGKWLAKALGFRRYKTPSKSMLSKLFRRLDAAQFEAKLAEWLGEASTAGGRQVAIDGKTLRGSRSGPGSRVGEAPGVHLLAAYAPEEARVLAQAPVDGKTNEHKAALALLRVTPLAGSVVTADAMFCHRDFCQEVLNREADYLITVKDNQSNLKRDIESALGELPEGLSPLGTQAAAGVA